MGRCVLSYRYDDLQQRREWPSRSQTIQRDQPECEIGYSFPPLVSLGYYGGPSPLERVGSFPRATPSIGFAGESPSTLPKNESFPGILSTTRPSGPLTFVNITFCTCNQYNTL